jgi:hypothetical protein
MNIHPETDIIKADWIDTDIKQTQGIINMDCVSDPTNNLFFSIFMTQDKIFYQQRIPNTSGYTEVISRDLSRPFPGNESIIDFTAWIKKDSSNKLEKLILVRLARRSSTSAEDTHL